MPRNDCKTDIDFIVPHLRCDARQGAASKHRGIRGGMSTTDSDNRAPDTAPVATPVSAPVPAVAADCTQAKRVARHRALQRRATLSEQDFADARPALASNAEPLIAALPRTATVAAYVSMGTEPPLDGLLEHLLGRGIRVLVPRLGSGRELVCAWSELESLERLHDMPRSASGGLRPREPSGPALAADSLGQADLILVPAFAIDPHGFRLGRGAGWYDRALVHASPTATIIGVCWPWEASANDLPHAPHDVPVGGILTTKHLDIFD